MNRSAACAVMSLVGAGIFATASSPDAGVRARPQAPAQSTFRSAATAVTVDVTVRDARRRPITGLTAGDFQVLDNGVLQQVDQVSYDLLPIDVTVALDVSYSVTGRLLDRLRRAVADLMRDLGDDDRLKLVLFNMRISRTIDFTNDVDAVERAIRDAQAGGGTALLDAISVALVSGTVPDRRQLVVFFTDGSDSNSITSAETLVTVAQRTRATLAFVMPADVMASLQVFPTLATETGGRILTAGTNTNLSSTFRRILGDFRSAYVLYYNASGVDRDGYHTLEVKVNREDAVVQARRGYFGS
jgi:VWFA-related protein